MYSMLIPNVLYIGDFNARMYSILCSFQTFFISVISTRECMPCLFRTFCISVTSTRDCIPCIFQTFCISVISTRECILCSFRTFCISLTTTHEFKLTEVMCLVPLSAPPGLMIKKSCKQDVKKATF